MTQTLKRCPFCKSENCEALIRFDIVAYGAVTGPSFVMCIDCRCKGPERDNKEEAIEAWNRRAGEE